MSLVASGVEGNEGLGAWEFRFQRFWSLTGFEIWGLRLFML